MRAAAERSLAGRGTKDDGAAGLVDGAADGLDLLQVVGTAEIVDLHEVHLPRGDEFEDGIVVGLRAGLVHVHAIHVGVPRAGAGGVGDVPRGVAGALHRQVLLPGLARDAAHHVDAELEALRVHVVGERLEAGATGGGGEAVGRGQHAAPLVHDVRGGGVVVKPGGVGLIPLDVHRDEVPAVGQQVGRQVVGLGLGALLVDRGAVEIPAVPAHHGALGPGVKNRRGGNGPERRGEKQKPAKQTRGTQ